MAFQSILRNINFVAYSHIRTHSFRLKPIRRVTIRKLSMGTAAQDSEMIELVRKIVPPMTAAHHKGQCGRIGIIGGCQEYTGAPYFAGISALKVGADLSHIFCTSGAAPVIKSYSPELIVHPVLDIENSVNEIAQWLPRLHALVIGPGLGRDEAIFATVREIIYKAKAQNLPLIIDADGLFLVTQTPEIIYGYAKTILTPNKMEFSRLHEKINSTSLLDPLPTDVQNLAAALDGVTIVSKGTVDIITDGKSTVLCKEQGSNRRCGGQGDLLSGSLGVFAYWSLVASEKNKGSFELGPTAIAGHAACFLTRQCNRLAYEQHKRSMTTSDMIPCIGQVFSLYFEVD